MHPIHVCKFGLAFGATLALLHLGCVAVMAVVGQEGSILFFNSLLHGLDVTSIIRMDMPVGEMIMGIVQTSILGWLFGAAVARIYNVSVSAEGKRQWPRVFSSRSRCNPSLVPCDRTGLRRPFLF